MEKTGHRIHLHLDRHAAGTGDIGSSKCACSNIGSLFGHSSGNHSLCDTTCHGIENAVVGIVGDGFGQIGVHILIKINRSDGLQPLIRTESTERPMPFAVVPALDRQFLQERVPMLPLRKVQEVLWTIIDIHEHIVMKILPRGHGVHVKALSCVLDAYPCMKDVAAIIPLPVLVGRLRTGLQPIER